MLTGKSYIKEYDTYKVIIMPILKASLEEADRQLKIEKKLITDNDEQLSRRYEQFIWMFNIKDVAMQNHKHPKQPSPPVHLQEVKISRKVKE